ncbi:MAG: AbrB family transcriptional regulator [Deltaproteobacteria bacterium]|nr:MAG: AbrB family transcriptional regulator [Deltaproteobacteria bacterium]
MTSAAMTDRGQITVPKKIREYLGIRAGDRINFEMTPGRAVVLRPCDRTLSVRDVCGILKTDKTVSVEEMDAAIASYHREKAK